MFEDWTRALLNRAAYEALAGLDDEALFRRVVRLALDAAPAAGVLGIYQETRSHAQAAIFLDELGHHPARRTPAMRAAVAALRAWGDDDDHAARHAWLRACVKARNPSRGSGTRLGEVEAPS